MNTRPHPNLRAARTHGRGIALIEVLVSMLVFALGVLALVGLQGAMVRAQTDAKVRADAAYLASELIGKMWADTENFAGFDDAGCEAQLACKEWQDKVALNLPSGEGAVAVNAGTGNVTVTITWSANGGGEHKYETWTTITKAGGV